MELQRFYSRNCNYFLLIPFIDLKLILIICSLTLKLMGITTSLRNRATWQITATLQAPGLIKSNLLQKSVVFL